MSLDPSDWQRFRELSHKALDDMVDFLSSVRERPVWIKAPEDVREAFCAPLPDKPTPFEEVLGDFERLMKPYANGNLHPLFMGWVHGAGTPYGMVAEMLAAGLNSNCGGRDHIAIEVERQITRWMAEAFGFPSTASGLFVTGTSTANFLALVVAREAWGGPSGVRANGLVETGRQLVAYTSTEAHNCVAKAMELAGIGSRHLRRIETDHSRRMRLDALQTAIQADRAAGHCPFLIMGTAGSVNTGATDDLNGLADVAEREDLWFHVDGAFGALCALSDRIRPRVLGLERAKSIAFDFHKWLHVPYDAGFLIVRDGTAHKRAFASEAAYLSRAAEGLAAGEPWPCDLGLDLSRGFRALKTWVTMKVFGRERLAAAMEENCRLAERLAAKAARTGLFEVVAPVALNIVCLSANADPHGALNEKIILDLQVTGLAAPSLTFLDERPVIRCAIFNHRTTDQDIDAFVGMLEASARRLGRS